MTLHGGLFQKPFEDSIESFYLRFKDNALEQAYLTARASLKLLSSSTKRFLLAAFAGPFIFYSIDIISTTSLNQDYELAPASWVFCGIFFPIIICEILCFTCNCLVPYRGIAFTVLGGLVLFHNNFADFEGKIFYPFFGEEYFFFLPPTLFFEIEYKKY